MGLVPSVYSTTTRHPNPNHNSLDKAYGPLGLAKEFSTPATGLVVFCAYSGLIAKRTAHMGSGSSATKVKRVELLVEFLGGAEFDGLILFDEAHRAKSFNIDKPESSSQMSQVRFRSCEYTRTLRAAPTLIQAGPPPNPNHTGGAAAPGGPPQGARRLRVRHGAAVPRVHGLRAEVRDQPSHASFHFVTWSLNPLNQTNKPKNRLLLWGNPSFPTSGDFAAKFMKKGDLSMLELLAVEMKVCSDLCGFCLHVNWLGVR